MSSMQKMGNRQHAGIHTSCVLNQSSQSQKTHLQCSLCNRDGSRLVGNASQALVKELCAQLSCLLKAERWHVRCCCCLCTIEVIGSAQQAYFVACIITTAVCKREACGEGTRRPGMVSSQSLPTPWVVNMLTNSCLLAKAV